MLRYSFLKKPFILFVILLFSIFSASLFSSLNISTFESFSSGVQSNPNTTSGNINSEQTMNSFNKTNYLNNISNMNGLYFEANYGQLRFKDVLFIFKSKNYQINFLPSQIEILQMSFGSHQIMEYNLSFQGSNIISPIGLQKLNQTNNYFINNIRISNVPLYSKIFYPNIYSGIDLEYVLTANGVKNNYIVHPGADVSKIKVKTSDNTFLSVDGNNFVIRNKNNGLNLLSDSNLFVYQEINGKNNQISSNFQVNDHNNVVGYNVSSYNTAYNLIIDPYLVFNVSTYLGGSGDDSAYDLVLDSQNNVYITGSTTSDNFLTTNPIYVGTPGNFTDIFIMKINSTGTGIIWSTYYGGNGEEQPDRIALDGNNNVVIIGYTNSTNFPTVHSQNTVIHGAFDAFVVALSNDGSKIILSSIIGGSGFDEAYGIYIAKSSTDYYIIGSTDSPDFNTTTNAFNKTYGGYSNDDAFFIKMNVLGQISYSTYIGGPGSDDGVDIAVDSQGNVYIVGSTNSNLNNIPLTGQFFSDIFLVKFDKNENLVYTKLIGGIDDDYPTSMAIMSNSLYLTGYTYSSDFPTNNTAFDRANPNEKSFVMQLDTNGTIIYSTFFGGTSSPLNFCTGYCITTQTTKIIVDSLGNATIVGYTNSNILTLDENKSSLTGSYDGFITTFNSKGTNITYSTYIGGSDIDHLYSVAMNTKNEIYIVGDTYSTDFPVINAIQNHISSIGNSDAFFSKLARDYTVPTLIVSKNFNYLVGSTGHNITFFASDNDPKAFYTVYKNGVEISNGLLQKTNVTFSVDGLDAGNYNYTIRAQDRTGNTITKMVLIQVYSETSNQPIIDFLLFIILIIIVVAVTVSVYLIALSKSNPEKFNTIKTKFKNGLSRFKNNSNSKTSDNPTEINQVNEKEEN